MSDDDKTTVERFAELMTEEVLTARKERDEARYEAGLLEKCLSIAIKERDSARARIDEADSRAHDAHQAAFDEVVAQLRNARATSQRLNRRCQDYERALAEKCPRGADGKPRGSLMSRAQLNAYVSTLRAELEELTRQLRLAETTRNAAQDIATRETERRRELEEQLDQARAALARHDDGVEGFLRWCIEARDRRLNEIAVSRMWDEAEKRIAQVRAAEGDHHGEG